jgi:hypothetical protein
LLESVEGTRQAALADAQKAKNWEERERLRQAAEKAYAGSISALMTAASFAEIRAPSGPARSLMKRSPHSRRRRSKPSLRCRSDPVSWKVKARADAVREEPLRSSPSGKGTWRKAERNHPPRPNTSSPTSRPGAGWVGCETLRVVSYPARRSDRPAEGNAKLETPPDLRGLLPSINGRNRLQDWARTQRSGRRAPGSGDAQWGRGRPQVP